MKHLRSEQVRPILCRKRTTAPYVFPRSRARHGESMATSVGRIAEQGLKLLNEMAAEAWSLESFASSGLDRLPRLVASEVTTLSICDLARGRRTVFSAPNRARQAAAAFCSSSASPSRLIFRRLPRSEERRVGKE